MTNLLNTPNNRIIAGIEAMQKRLDEVDQAARDSVDANATLDASELLHFGDKASLALARGIVTADEAQTLYCIWNDFDSASTAQRVVYMQAIMETMR